jgi:hypothetical protein
VCNISDGPGQANPRLRRATPACLRYRVTGARRIRLVEMSAGMVETRVRYWGTGGSTRCADHRPPVTMGPWCLLAYHRSQLEPIRNSVAQPEGSGSLRFELDSPS